MRIAMLVESYYPRTRGGIEVYTRQLASELRGAGHEVIFVCPSHDGSPATSTPDGIPVHHYPVPSRLTRAEERLETRPRDFDGSTGSRRR